MTKLKVNYVKESIKLREVTKTVCAEIKVRARIENKTICLKERKRIIYIGDALKRLELDPHLLGKTLGFYPQVKRYFGKEIKCALSLVKSAGGVDSAIEKVTQTIIFDPTLTEFEKAYLNQVIYSLQDCKSCCDQMYIRRNRFLIPFCCICWREVTSSRTYYCSKHSRDKDLCASDTAKLLATITNSDKEMKRKIDELRENASKEEYYRKIYAALLSLTEISTQANEYLVISSDIDYLGEYWKEYAELIMKVVNLCCPNTYNEISCISISNYTNWNNFIYAIFSELDKNRVRKVDIDVRFVNDGLFLLNVLRRYEGYLSIQKAIVKPGPKAGTVKRNDSLRQEIYLEAKQQIENSGRINAASIGNKFSVSRQRVSILLKELELR